MKQLAILLLLVGLHTASYAAPDVTQLQGTWYIQSMVVDGAAVSPDAQHAADTFTFNADMAFSGVIEGVTYGGTYGVDVTETWITIYATADLAFRARILSLTADALQVQMIGTDGNVYVLNYDREL